MQNMHEKFSQTAWVSRAQQTNIIYSFKILKNQRETSSIKALIFIYIMSLRIVVVCADYLRNKNESNDKKRKKESKKEKNKQCLYVR